MLFHNLAPRLQSSDLHVDMPCSLPVYLASSAADCYICAIADGRPPLPVLADVVSIFFKEDWNAADRTLSDGLTGLHLFVSILGERFRIMVLFNRLTPFQRCFRNG